MWQKYTWVACAVCLAGFPLKAGATELANITAIPHYDLAQPPQTSSKPVASRPSARSLSLHDAIHHFEQLAERPWPYLAGMRSLRLGDRSAEVRLLRQRLQLLGDLPESDRVADPQLFDEEVEAGLRHFQSRHGLESDGILGRRSRQQLNIPPAARLPQLRVNLLRQEAFAQRSGDRYVQVNIPDFRLRVVTQGELRLSMKAIVGRKTRQTPLFDSKIDTLVVHPDWNVPKSIAYRDILPAWNEDPTYLERHNLKVVSGWGEGMRDIPGDQVDRAQLYSNPQFLRFWEPPGPNNTLGQVKFLAPNGHAVYLHDTSAKSLFRHTRRAFSSGCIRLEKPRQLTDLLLSLGNAWQPEQVAPLFSESATRRIALQRPIPLHINYWTAWIDARGRLQFREDLYRRDARDLAALQQDAASTLTRVMPD